MNAKLCPMDMNLFMNYQFENLGNGSRNYFNFELFLTFNSEFIDTGILEI